MSNTDNNDPANSIGDLSGEIAADTSAQMDEQAADGRAAAAEVMYQAEDLKDLLQQIAHQISDADKRHGKALQAMQQRLAAIGDQAEQVKTNVPEEFRPAFERIEDAVSLLGERIALAASERQARQHTQQQPPVEQQPAPVEDADTAVNEQFERELTALKETVLAANKQTQNEVEDVAATEPQAEMQASASAATRTDDALPAAPQHGLAMPASIAADPTQPWDADSVDALVQLYDAGPEGLPPPPVSAPPVSDQQTVAAPAIGAGHSLADSRINGEWLEAKFADMAARVEMSLADIKPDLSMDVLGERFDRLETHLDTALQDVVSKNDVAGLNSIEHQLTELSGHLQQTQGQLTRLDGIEDGLSEIIGQITGSLDNQGQNLGSQENMTALAETVAVRVAQTISDGRDNSDDKEARLDDLRAMLTSYMDERRKGEKSTSGALDTMQEALIHLVERVDAMETNVAKVVEAPATLARAPSPETVAHSGVGPVEAAPASEPLAAAALLVEPKVYAGDAARFEADQTAKSEALYKGPEHLPSEVGATTGVAPSADGAPPRAQSATKAKTAAYRPGRDPVAKASEDELVLSGNRPEPGAASASASRPRLSPAASSQAASPKGLEAKEDFIEQARRAQRLAGEAMEKEEQARKGDAGAATGLKSRIAGATRKNKSQAAGPKAKSKGVPRSLLVACAALALVTMGTLLYGNLSGGSGGVPKIEKKFVKPQSGKSAMKLNNGTASGSGVATKATMDTDAGAASDMAPGETTLPPKPSLAPATEGNQKNGQLKDSRLLNRQIPGIAVHKPRRGLSATALARINERNQMAKESARMATRDELVPASNASLQSGSDVTVSALDPAKQASASRELDMPPALIGPLSLRLAAAKGDPSAEFEIAARFAAGKGVKQDFEAAGRWYQRSAARGFAPAQYRLGTLYERGLGVSSDMARARIWYLRAAKQGNVKAMHNLAVLNAGRVGAAPDYVTAAQWFTEAGERGLADSQFNLGILYESGLGVARDLVNSYKWFSLAAARGDKQAARRRDALRSKLSPAQLTSAERKVRSWHQTPVENLVNDPRAAGQAWLGHGSTGRAG